MKRGETAMSRYAEFCESLWVGQAKTREQRLKREDEERTLPQTVADIICRMCADFQCPDERLHYMDTRSGIATGTLRDGTHLLLLDPEKGRFGVDFQIGVAGRPEDEPYPVWVHLECVPLRHGGLEFHLGSDILLWPEEEKGLFDAIAATINRELREGHVPGPRRIGS
jgi:hypothetical protein